HAAWMNDYFREIMGVNKIRQLAVARSCGLETPETLVTQNEQAAREFYDKFHGGILCKAIGQAGHVPGDSLRNGRVIYANKVEEDAACEFERVAHGPT